MTRGPTSHRPGWDKEETPPKTYRRLRRRSYRVSIGCYNKELHLGTSQKSILSHFWRPESKIKVWGDRGRGRRDAATSQGWLGPQKPGEEGRTLPCSLRPHRDLPLSRCLSVTSPLPIPYKSLDLGPPQVQDDLILRCLTSSHLQKFYFQIRSHSQVLGVRTWVYFGGPL